MTNSGSSNTVAVHVVTMADPLQFGSGLKLDLIRCRYFFLSSSSACETILVMTKVLQSLGVDKISLALSLFVPMEVFLVILALGLCASQLHALIHQLVLIVVSPDSCLDSLTPFPTWLATNKREGHCLEPIVIPAWQDVVFHHLLCLLSSQIQCLDLTSQSPPGVLFEDSLKPFVRINLTIVFFRMVEASDG